MDEVFRKRVASRQPTAGTFMKSGAPEVLELFGYAGLDFAVIDAEHAPLGIAEIDRLVLAARASGLPCLVRIPSLVPALAGQILDLGATGVVIPHISDGASARTAVEETRYLSGRRGYSPSTRAGCYGLGDTASHAVRADAAISLWLQIEDAEALDQLDEIAATDGVDLLFIGRADLAMSLGVPAIDHPRVMQAVRAIASAGARHGKTVGIFVADMAEARALVEIGISVFACGSDQSYLASAARSIIAARKTLENGTV